MTIPSALDDLEKNMVVLFQQGDKSDYLKLYDKYAPAFLGVLTRTLRNQKLAEECVSESFCKMWIERLNYNPAKERLFTWMLKIVRSCAACEPLVEKSHLGDEIREQIDLIYATDIKTYLLEKQHAEGPDFAVEIDADIRQAIHLIYFENCSFALAAEKLRMSVDYLRGAMVKTIKRLKGSVLA